MPIIRLLLTIAVVFTLVSLPSVLSNNFSLPSIPLVRAQQENTLGSWYPAGAQEQTLSISTFTGPMPEFNSIVCPPSCPANVDFISSPLSASEVSTCPGSVAIICTAPVVDKGYFEIEFNLAGALWGIPSTYGNNTAGIQLRQGIAHLVNKASLATTGPGCAGAGAVCVANDDPLPPCSAFSCQNGGLVNANPCGWDTLFPESSSANCIVGAPGGTAYNCAYSIVCPSGTVTGTSQFPWQPSIGSPDFCAAAQHFKQAFQLHFGISVTLNSSCELVPPAGGWPSSVTALASGCSGAAVTADACFFVRNTEPRKSLGEGLAQEICALFSPAWTGGTGWTTLAGQPSSCDNTNTGTGNADCGGGSCPFLQVTEGPISSFCGFGTPPGTVNLCWGLYTGGFGQVFPFDSSLYFQYNSLFAIVSCFNVVCPPPIQGSPCASTTAPVSGSDYMYVCSPPYDAISSQMENAPCLAANGDPVFGQSTPSFANCPGTSNLSSVSAGYQAVDLFGKNAYTVPIWTGTNSYARLSNWARGGTTPGVSTAIGGGLSGLPNYFNWLDAYSPSPAVQGTIRQGFMTTPDSLNPFGFTTLWDSYVLSNIYDSLFEPNPLCSIAAGPGVTTCSSILQNIDWMTTSHSFLCYTGGPACTSAILGYGNSTYFAGTTADLRLSLNRANHWQDGGPVTAWDVKYSFSNLNATGAFQASSLAIVAHINVIDEFTLDLNLKAKGPFTELFIGGITIVPGHVWTSCSANIWASFLASKNVKDANIVSAAEDSCIGTFSSPNIVTVGGIRADSPAFDPVTNGFLIGSGPYTCESVGGTGHPTVGTIGGGCSADNTQSPAPALGDYTLTRTGCTLTSTGTTCGVAGSGSDYFRSSGALAAYIWTGDIGSGSADFSKVLTVNSCHSATPSANCPHWAQGIGNPGGTGSNAVGLSQRLKVNSLKGISWIGFSTEKNTATQLILTCSAGYTLPGTTITPCNAANAGWTTTVLPGIGVYDSVLYEVGSQITIGTVTTSTSTLSPASVAGCGGTTTYPNGGYDC